MDHLKVNKEKEMKRREILDYTNFSDGSGPNFFGLGQAQQLTVRARASSSF